MIFKTRNIINIFSICLLTTFTSKSISQELTYIQNSSNVTLKYQQQNNNQEIRLCWDDSLFKNGVGLTSGGTFTSAIRFNTDTLASYQQYQVKKLDIYFNETPSLATIKIWQGENQNNLQEKLSFTYNPQPESWNEITLEEPFTIDYLKELWVGVSFESEAGIKPAGTDTLTNAEGYGNMVKIGDNDWTTLSTYHIKGDWNIQLIIEKIEIEGYTVNINLDMTNATFGNESEAFDPRNHKVYISGSMNEWAVPGSDDTYEMQLNYDDSQQGQLPTTLYESWENYEEFAQDISPWMNVFANESTDTWLFGDFDFTGEGTAFSFMVFNPDSTKPSISELYPAYFGEKYLIAVQSVEPNDDKWLISPQLMGTQTSKLGFWAKSISDVYGAERIQVLVSTTNTELASFTKISEEEYLEVPTSWTLFEFDLSDYNDQPYYFAIRYISEDSQMLMIDNVEVTADQSLPEEWIYNLTLYFEGTLDYKYFVVKDEPTTDYAEWLETDYRTVNILSNRTINDIWGVPTSAQTISNFLNIRLFPNPASNSIQITSDKQIREVNIYDISGRIVKFTKNINSWDTILDINHLKNGVYIVQVMTTDGTEVNKLMINK